MIARKDQVASLFGGWLLFFLENSLELIVGFLLCIDKEEVVNIFNKARFESHVLLTTN